MEISRRPLLTSALAVSTAGALPLTATRTAIGAWEKFDLVNN